MVILGVDPGLSATGYGVIEADRRLGVKLKETGVIKPSVKDSLPVRLHKVYRNIDEIIREFTPEVMVLEKLYAHAKYPSTAPVIGHVRGVICMLCNVNQIQLAEHSVKRIRKALLGNGNASKQQTRVTVGQVLGMDVSQLTLDASDALALALGYARMNSMNLQDAVKI